MKVSIGLSEKNRTETVILLNALLANEFTLYAKTLNFHWNLKGSDFFALHKFFQDLYEKLFEINDDVAERVQQLGGTAFGSLAQFLEHATIKQHIKDSHIDQMAMIEHMLHDHELIIQQIRRDIGIIQDTYTDLGTGNFLTDIMEKHEKMAWMLRSFFTK